MLRDAQKMAEWLQAAEPQGFPEISPLPPRNMNIKISQNCIVCVHARRTKVTATLSHEPELLVEWAHPFLGKSKLAWMREGRVRRLAWPEVDIFNARSCKSEKPRPREQAMSHSANSYGDAPDHIVHDGKESERSSENEDDQERDQTWNASREIATKANPKKVVRRRCDKSQDTGRWIAVVSTPPIVPPIRKPRTLRKTSNSDL